MIPYGRQDITSADIDAVVTVLKSDFLTQGPMVPRFEETVAGYCGANHAVAVKQLNDSTVQRLNRFQRADCEHA
jgi:dTDP-4-amino-4,6-dideoxygalactose transaminase